MTPVQIKMGDDLEGLYSVLKGMNLSSFPSAKIKVDELYLLWLSSNDGASAMMGSLEECRTGIYSSAASSSSAGLGGSASNLGSAPGAEISQTKTRAGYLSHLNVASKNQMGQEPPRSPTKKSPKKRTQSEMQREIGGGGILSLKSDEGGVGSLGSGGAVGNRTEDEARGFGGKVGGNIPKNDYPSSSLTQASVSGKGGNSLFVGPAGEGGGGEDGTSTRRRRARFDTIPAFYTPEMRQSRGLGYSVRRGSARSAGGSGATLATVDISGGNIGNNGGDEGKNEDAMRANLRENDDSLVLRRAEIEEFFAGERV